MYFKFLKKLTRNFLLVPITTVVALLFVASCIASELNPEGWWFVGLLSLLLPYLIFLLVFACIFWLIVKPAYVFIPLLALMIGWRQIAVVFSYHVFSTFHEEYRAKNSIRIVSWNVGSMYGLSNKRDHKIHDRKEIANTILGLEPDIICLQEFNNSETQGKDANNIALFSEDYPYHFYSKDLNKRDGYYESGSIIFSKFPILYAAKIRYPSGISESFIYADIRCGSDTVRVFNVHLQSYKFSRQNYEDIEDIKNVSDSSIKASKRLMSKMQTAYAQRGIQANIIRSYSDSTKFKSVICGDFNDVPGSFAYFKIRADRQDAFLEKSWGTGRTYYSIAPMLRIDYILPDKNFEVNQFDIIDENLSDHLMLVSDLILKK